MSENKEFTKYEQARMIGSRALQLSMGAPFMTELSEDELKRLKYSTVEIAKLEYGKGLLPLDVVRPFPGVRPKLGKKE